MEVAPFAASRNLARCSFAVHRGEEKRDKERDRGESVQRRKRGNPPARVVVCERYGGQTVSVPFRLGETTPDFSLPSLAPWIRTRNAVYRGHWRHSVLLWVLLLLTRHANCTPLLWVEPHCWRRYQVNPQPSMSVLYMYDVFISFVTYSMIMIVKGSDRQE